MEAEDFELDVEDATQLDADTDGDSHGDEDLESEGDEDLNDKLGIDTEETEGSSPWPLLACRC
jgi:ATP-dependent RNA helicase DHX37/DHR1